MGIIILVVGSTPGKGHRPLSVGKMPKEVVIEGFSSIIRIEAE
jgi:hypothetical protein